MIRLICTGDILPADRQHTPGVGTGTAFENRRGVKWESFFTKFDKNKDVLFGNLEAPLVNLDKGDIENTKKPFSGDPGFGSWLNKVGYDVVSIANNHILEHGEAGFRHTCSVLERYEVWPVGIYNDDTGSNIGIIEKEGIRIGFSSFNAIHDIANPSIYSNLNEEAIRRAILSLKETANIICLSFHWGNEYIHFPSFDQIKMARLAIDLGADIIIGHHPHVIQPIEQYKNGWIVYSLGNFIFDMRWSQKVRTGMCVEFELNRNGVLSCTSYAVESKKDYTPVLNQNNEWFNTVLSKNQQIMNKLLEEGADEYNRYYWQHVKKNRFRARVGMKLQLAQQWFSISKLDRKKIRKELIEQLYK